MQIVDNSNSKKMVCSINALLFVSFLSVVVVAWGNVNNYEEFCTINTESCRLRGKLNRTLYDKVPYYSFRGIPFGKPPIGSLRFKVNYFYQAEDSQELKISEDIEKIDFLYRHLKRLNHGMER